MMQFQMREVEEPSYVSPNRSNKNISSHSVSKHCIQVDGDFFRDHRGKCKVWRGEMYDENISRSFYGSLEFFECL